MSGLSLLSDIAQTGRDPTSENGDPPRNTSKEDMPDTSKKETQNQQAEYSHTIPFKFVPDTDTAANNRDLLPPHDQQALRRAWGDRWRQMQHQARRGRGFGNAVQQRMDRPLQWMIAENMRRGRRNEHHQRQQPFLHPGVQLDTRRLRERLSSQQMGKESSTTTEAIELHLRRQQQQRQQRQQLQQIQMLRDERRRDAALKMIGTISGLPSAPVPVPQTAVAGNMQREPDNTNSQSQPVPRGSPAFGHQNPAMIAAVASGAKMPASPMTNPIGSVASKATVPNRALAGRLMPKPAMSFDNLSSGNGALPMNLGGLVNMKRNAAMAEMPADPNSQLKRSRRRQRHNNTELRRMAKIRRAIEELKEVMELDGVRVKGSKAVILNKAVEHMLVLQATIRALRGGKATQKRNPVGSPIILGEPATNPTAANASTNAAASVPTEAQTQPGDRGMGDGDGVADGDDLDDNSKSTSSDDAMTTLPSST